MPAKLCSFWMELAYIKLVWSSDSAKVSSKKCTVCKKEIEHHFGELSQRNQGYSPAHVKHLDANISVLNRKCQNLNGLSGDLKCKGPGLYSAHIPIYSVKMVGVITLPSKGVAFLL